MAAVKGEPKKAEAETEHKVCGCGCLGGKAKVRVKK